MTKIRCAYQPSLRTRKTFTKPSRSVQYFKQDCDINLILKKYAATGEMPSISHSKPFYGDFTDIPDYAQACDRVNRANASFMSLPSNLRNRFDNDPSKLIAFVSDPSNLEEACKLGLITAPDFNKKDLTKEQPKEPAFSREDPAKA
jgi:phage internal scaffolding protein